MRVFWTEWPNEPALAEFEVDGTRVVQSIGTETTILAYLKGVGDATVLCSTPPRWCFRLPERVCVITFDGHPVLPAVKQLIHEGRYRVYGDWIWTPELHLLGVTMRAPRPWILELAEGDRTDGSHPDHRVEPVIGCKGRCDKHE